MKKVKLLIAFFLLIGISGYTQNITGKVYEAKSNLPLPFASVVLFNSSDSLVVGTTTNMSGDFKIKTQSGSYFLQIQVLGFEKLKTAPFKISDENYDLGELKLQETDFELSEVVVSAEKSHLVNKPGKQVLNVGKDISGAGGNISNVLTVMPSVEVSSQGDVSIRGNDNVKVLINGKEVSYGISADKMLKQIPSSSVEKVEVVTNNSAKDDPESSGGTINIVLKKDKKAGVHGGINIDYGVNPKQISGGGSLFISKNDFSTYLTYGYYNMEYKMLYNDNRNYTNQNPAFKSTNYNGLGNYFVVGNLLMTGFDYSIKNKHTINTEVILSRFTEKWNFDQGASYTYADNTTSTNKIYNKNKDGIRLADVSLTVDNNFSENHKLKSIVKYSFGEFGGKRESTYSDNTIPLITENEGAYGMGELKSDYEWTISQKSSFEAGVFSNLLHFNFDVSGEEKLKYNFNQQKLASYGIFTQKISNLSIGLGARLEQYTSLTEEENNDNNVDQNYLKLYPNLQLQYQFGKENKQTLSLSYSKKIRRPGYEELNPIVDQSDPLHISQGNPELEPEFINSLELNHYVNILGSKFNTTIFGNINTGVIQRKTEVIDDYRLKTTYINFSNQKNLGIETNWLFDFYEKLDLSTSFLYMYKWFGKNPDGTPAPYSKGEEWSLKLNNTYKLTKAISVPFQVQYYGTSVNSFVKRKPYYQLDAGIKFKVLKGLADFSIIVNDITNTGGKETYLFKNEGYESQAVWHVEERNIKFSLTIQM